MDQRALKTSLCYIFCRAIEVRFYAAELELSFMRAQPLKPAEVLWRTVTEKLFSSDHMGFFIIQYQKSDFISCGSQGHCKCFFFFSMFRM